MIVMWFLKLPEEMPKHMHDLEPTVLQYLGLKTKPCIIFTFVKK